jgi:polyisoprenoid-binding protein YceI
VTRITSKDVVCHNFREWSIVVLGCANRQTMKLFISYLLLSTFLLKSWEFKVISKQSTMKIKGTSTVHDWESVVEEFEVEGLYEENRFLNVKARIPVKSIESGNGIMDDKTCTALKEEEHPEILFFAPELIIANGRAQGKGSLTIGGVSRQVMINAISKHTSSGTIQVTGSNELKMTDFGIDPPKAMFGTLTTGDLITIEYQLILTK